jgi:hypothetical protein
MWHVDDWRRAIKIKLKCSDMRNLRLVYGVFVRKRTNK